MEAIYFCVEGWTGVIGLKWLIKLDFWRTRGSAVARQHHVTSN
jgi:hypothetical protein